MGDEDGRGFFRDRKAFVERRGEEIVTPAV
jgi:hypothetical protein